MSNEWIDQNVDREVSDYLLKFKVNLPNRTPLECDCRSDLNIDYEALEVELQETPSTYAFWAAVMSEARAEVAKLELYIKARTGALTKYLINQYESKGRKLTKDQREDYIKADEDLISLQQRKIKADKISGKLYHIVEAIKMKSEHLRSLSGFKRQELRDAEGG